MILVTGARGVVGVPLIDFLRSQGLQSTAVSRKELSGQSSLVWDLDQAPDYRVFKQLRGLTTVVHCAPLWLLPAHLPSLHGMGLRKIIAFSSSSIEGKASSTNVKEQQVVEQLRSAEEELTEFALENNIELVILRPSMIYGYGRDQNITHLAKFIGKFGFSVLAGRGRGLRQPVHVDDLVQAIYASLNQSFDSPTTLTLAGGEQIEYRQMVERIAEGLGRSPKVFSVPVSVFKLALKLAAVLGRFHYTADMADRMNQDLVYDNSEAESLIDFNPQSFLQAPQRDLPRD